jgi:hypothetical protein
VHFCAPPWSGWLSQGARRSASVDLRTTLLENYRLHPNADHFVIGHSHGGNISLYAIDSEEEHGPLKGIICLNTPFITALRRNTQNFVFPFLFAVFFWMVAFSASIVFLPIAIGLSDLFGYSQAFRLSYNPSAGLSAIRFFAASLGAGIVALGALYLVRRRCAIDNFFQRNRERVIDHLSLPQLKRIKVLALWNASDEVYGPFSLLEALASVSYLLMHAVVLLLVFLVTFFLAIFDIGAALPYSSMEGILVKWNPTHPSVRSIAEGVLRFQAAFISAFAASRWLSLGRHLPGALCELLASHGSHRHLMATDL